MSDNWVVQNLENALETWNEKLAEIWQLITTTPQDFKGGGIWGVIVNINGAVQAIGLALLCHCLRSHHLLYGTDARPVQHRAGDDLHHYEFGGLFFAATDNAAG